MKNRKTSVLIEVTAESPDVFGGLSHWTKGTTMQGYVDTHGTFRPCGQPGNLVIEPAYYKVVKSTEPTLTVKTPKHVVTAHTLKRPEKKRKTKVYVDQLLQPSYARMVASGNRTAREVAVELDVSTQTVYSWVTKLANGGYNMSRIAGFRRGPVKGSTRVGV